VALAIALLAGSCSLIDQAPTTHRGLVSFGFEVEGFSPCGSAESWWVTGVPVELRQTYQAAVGFNYVPVYVVVEGTLGEPGSYGHLGAYQREIRITRLVEIDTARRSC